jgi:hypothetical protein
MTTLRFAALAAAILLLTACKPPSQDKAPVVVVAPLDGAPAAPAPAAAPPPGPVGKGLHALDARALGVTRHAAPASCNIETIGKVRFGAEPVAIDRKPFLLQGWFLSERSKRTGIPAALRLTDASGTKAWDVAIEAFKPRPNVNKVMKGVDAGNAGFAQVVDPAGLPSGRYTVQLVFADAGTALACDKAGGQPGAVAVFDLK